MGSFGNNGWIVGKGTNRSCILSSQINYLELNPYWNIPSSIIYKEILPKIFKNKNYLVENGIDASRLSSAGYGESKPIDSNKTAKGKANNRRVEVKLVK